MVSGSIFWLGACMVVLASGAPLAGQVRHYHTELWEATDGRVVVLFNDSKKMIEAYHYTGSCEHWSTEQSDDALSGTNSGRPHVGADGKTMLKDQVLEPGDRMVTMQTLPMRKPGCEWTADIDAVLYADGSYEGEELSARKLAARRDGIARAVRYWARRFKQESAAGLDGGTILADAERLSLHDRSKVRPGACLKSPIACSYWRGRGHVDGNVALRAKPQTGDAAESYQAMVWFVEQWERKIEDDVALRQTDAVLALPADIREMEVAEERQEPAKAP